MFEVIRRMLQRQQNENSPRKRGFVFWALSPWLVLFVVVMGLLIDKSDPGRLAVLVGMELLAILMLIGLWDAERFWWAWRGVGALVFLAYVAYLISMLMEEWGGIKIPKRRGDATFVNALIGLFAFGLPGLWYAISGRLTLRENDRSKQSLEWPNDQDELKR